MRWGWRLLLITAAMAVAIGIGGLFRQALWENIDLEVRHRLVAFVSGLTARRPETADQVAIRPRVDNPIGVNVFLDQEASVEARRRNLEMLRAAGVGWVRQQFAWMEIERDAKGDFFDRKWNQSAWASYDEIVDLALAHGVQVIARVDTSPAWARPGNAWDRSPPERDEDFGDFIYALASRYRGRVRAYQIWNEPNLAVEWGRRPPDPTAYARLLRVATERIKQADSEAIVLTAAMAPTIEESEQALNELVYLQRLYDAGAGGTFDVLAVQAYGLRNGPDDHRLSHGDVNFSRATLVRELMVRNGDAARPVWASEIGWNAQPPSFPGPAPYGAVSEELQARYTVRAFERAHQEWPWMGVMAVWFLKLPAAWDVPAQPWHFFRILDPDFTPHPLYHALRAYAAERGLRSED
ncbi:MAG: cellulase family glycosylhydrolase [Chloroflexi bacterium]|nr:cellulase family glycosylhydrolase [Chloroflexota bacterium]